MPLSTAQLPVRLRDLLLREVCMDISRAHVEEALNQVERESELLRKTRPPFLFLQGKSMRSEFQQRESGAAVRAGPRAAVRDAVAFGLPGAHAERRREGDDPLRHRRGAEARPRGRRHRRAREGVRSPLARTGAPR